MCNQNTEIELDQESQSVNSDNVTGPSELNETPAVLQLTPNTQPAVMNGNNSASDAELLRYYFDHLNYDYGFDHPS